MGSLLEKYEGMDHATGAQVAAILNELRRDAMALSPLSKARMLSLRLSWNELLRMYYKYIGVLGNPKQAAKQVTKFSEHGKVLMKRTGLCTTRLK